MNRAAGKRRIALIGTAALALVGGTACAGEALPAGGASGGPYRIDAMTIDGGGGRSGAGAVLVEGSAGQHDADPLQPSSGGPFSVTGGFWPAGARPEGSDRLFADGFEGPRSVASRGPAAAD